MRRNFRRAVRHRLLCYELPCFFAPLVKGRWVFVLLVIGIVLLIIGLSLFPLPEMRIELPLGLIELSVSPQELASYGVPVGLGLVMLALLGWVAGRWAAPRARFWEALEALGVRVVWDGEEEGFRERVDEAMGFALGRGPSGRLLPAYVRRQEEEEALRFLQKHVWGPEKQAYGVVIAGPPVAGKTRTAMELALRLNPPFVLIWPRGKKEGVRPLPSEMKLPFPRAIVLGDDLPLRPGGEGPSLPEELKDLLSACPGLALIATAREDRIPPDVRGVRVVVLQEISWDERLEKLAQEVAEAEGRPVAEVRDRFTGHPGSLAAGLDVFRQRYNELPDEMGRVLRVQAAPERDRLGGIGRRFLQSARALWDLGVRTLSLERVWAVVEKAGNGRVVLSDRTQTLEALEKLSFLRVERGKRAEVAKFYEAILTEVIPQEKGWERTAWEALEEQQDAAAFEEIGNTWSEEYSPAYQRNPRESLRRAIEAYREALRFYTPEVAPLKYAMTQNSLGIAYRNLAEHEDPVGNLRRAIEAFKEALRFYTPAVAPLDYAWTQNNLGVAYRHLAEYEDPGRNLEWALQAFQEALHFRTREQTPLPYAETQHEMGRAYRLRAEFQTDPVLRCADLQAAVQAFREALRFRTPEATPRWHAKTRQALEEAEEALRQAGCPEAS